MFKMWSLNSFILVALTFGCSMGYSFSFDNLMQEQADDTALVESTIREARAVRPQTIHDLLKPGVKEAYLHTYGDAPGADGNVQGFLKKTNDKGEDGYKHFDSFHKKDADKYGFEVNSEYGRLNKAEVDTKDGKQKKAKIENDGVDETRKTYKVVEDPESSSYYGGDFEGESQQYADNESNTDDNESNAEATEEEEEESSPYSSYESEAEDGDGESTNEEKSSYSSSSDDGDEESESHSSDDDEE